ncbi:OmpA family protein [Acetobacteraceae bacterium KSS8]|uniref:OmpA family protein n=1 Tax=Endosaccharibacter trunci TaxID=2812733 RepID=A0ABT1W7U4_9PROT|nr:OmpA family protein [Acetobacteraceae bacterium KSS8]
MRLSSMPGRRSVSAFALATSLGLLAGCADQTANGDIGRKYVLFFTKGSTAISPAGSGVLRQAARVAGRHPDLGVLVAGFAAAHGNIDADQALSEQRARIVAAALQGDGVPAARIVERARPPSNEDPGVAARRVEVSFFQQP